MNSEFYYAALAFFLVVFVVFYSIAYSVLRTTWENFQSYQRKSGQKWSGEGQKRRKRTPILWLLLLSGATAWLVVHFLIQPN